MFTTERGGGQKEKEKRERERKLDRQTDRQTDRSKANALHTHTHVCV